MSKKVSLKDVYKDIFGGAKKEKKPIQESKEPENDLSQYKGLLSENLRRLQSVGHNKYGLVTNDFGGYATKETQDIAESFKQDQHLVESARVFMSSYNGFQPYRDFIQREGLSGDRNIRGTGWINQNLAYDELNDFMRKL